MAIIRAYSPIPGNGLPIGSAFSSKTVWSSQSETAFIASLQEALDFQIQVYGTAFKFSEDAEKRPVSGFVDSAVFVVNSKIMWTIDYIASTPIDFSGPRQQGLSSWYKNDDFYIGINGRDTFLGFSGNDVFYGGGGLDTFEGGPGIDTAEFEGKRGEYEIAHNPSNLMTTSKLKIKKIGSNGQDETWTNAERLRFDDVSVAYDLSPKESAGQALRLIASVAGKAFISDPKIVGEIINYSDALGYSELSKLFVSSGVVSSFSGNDSDSALISLLYRNLVGHNPDADELQWNVDFMRANDISQAQVLEIVANMDITAQAIGMTGLAEKGVEYFEFL